MKFKKQRRDGSVESWWSVRPTHDYTSDCLTGEIYAEQFIDALSCGEAQTALPHIVKAMPDEMTGVEIGFLHAISDALQNKFWTGAESASFTAA